MGSVPVWLGNRCAGKIIELNGAWLPASPASTGGYRTNVNLLKLEWHPNSVLIRGWHAGILRVPFLDFQIWPNMAPCQAPTRVRAMQFDPPLGHPSPIFFQVQLQNGQSHQFISVLHSSRFEFETETSSKLLCPLSPEDVRFDRRFTRGIRFAFGVQLRLSDWWFGTLFIVPYIANNHPNWIIFFRGVGIPPTSY